MEVERNVFLWVKDAYANTFLEKENWHCFFFANNMPFFYLANKNQVNLFGVSSFFLNFAEINFDSMKSWLCRPFLAMAEFSNKFELCSFGLTKTFKLTSVLGSTALQNSASVIGEV